MLLLCVQFVVCTKAVHSDWSCESEPPARTAKDSENWFRQAIKIPSQPPQSPSKVRGAPGRSHTLLSKPLQLKDDNKLLQKSQLETLLKLK